MSSLAESPIVRRVAPEDWPALKRLRLAALRTDPLAFGSTFEREAAFDDAVWIERAATSASAADRATWIAERTSTELVGMVGAYTEPGTVGVFGMWVEPSARGMGLAGRLLDEMLAWAGAYHPGARIRLGVNPDLIAAVRLYSSRGFQATGQSKPLDHAPQNRIEEMVRAAAQAFETGIKERI